MGGTAARLERTVAQKERSRAPGFVLQSPTKLANGGDWQDMSVTPVQEVDPCVVSVPIENGAHCFRLRK